MEKIYNLGIIGFGSMANTHRRLLTETDVRVKVKGIFDINPERERVASEDFGLLVYSSAEELLADQDIDIVLVATCNDTHAYYSIKALEAGKHVICEKPVTMTSKELKKVMKVAEKTGKVFTVNQNRRQNLDFVSMCRQIDSGLIGKPYYIETRVEGSRGLPEGWRQNKAQGGGMLYDWGVHIIDQIMYKFISPVTDIYCKIFNVGNSEVDESFMLILTFSDGLTAQIEVSTNSFIKHNRFFVRGNNGTIAMNWWDGTGKLVYQLKEDKDFEMSTGKVGPSKTMADRNAGTFEEIDILPPTDITDNTIPSYTQMLDAIENKAELKITPDQAMRVIKVIETAFESAKTGKSIKCNI